MAEADGVAAPGPADRAIQTLEVLHEPFTRPTGFDLGAYQQSYVDDFADRRHTDTATIRLSPALLEDLPTLVEPSIRDAVARTASRPDADGWVRAEVPIENVPHAHRLFLGFGADVEVLGPPQLRDRLAATVTTLARTYARTAAAPPE